MVGAQHPMYTQCLVVCQFARVKMCVYGILKLWTLAAYLSLGLYKMQQSVRFAISMHSPTAVAETL